METYFSVSLHGTFVFRTDTFLRASAAELARVEFALQPLIAVGYKVDRYERPDAGWNSKEVE